MQTGREKTELGHGKSGNSPYHSIRRAVGLHVLSYSMRGRITLRPPTGIVLADDPLADKSLLSTADAGEPED